MIIVISLSTIILSLFYSALKPKKSLPIYNPSMVNSELVDSTVQYISKYHSIADFSFTNQNGKIITQKDYEGKIYVADFFFTTCGSICPKMTTNLVEVQKAFINNPNVSPAMNTFYEQATTINQMGNDDYTYSAPLDPTFIGLGQKNDGLQSTRYINRWDIVDPRIVQNVDNIVMNMKNADGHVISLHQCGVSSRNELRNYVEINNC